MRRATVSLLLCGCLTGILALPALGGGMDIPGVGARAKSLGGAFRAIANDWSAAYYNPAGLFYVTENQLAFNEVFTNYRARYTPAVTYNGFPVGFHEGDIRNRYEILTNPTLGGFVKIPIMGKDIVTGLAIFQPFDMNIAWQVFQPINNGFSLPGQQIENNFDAVAINWVGATELMENRLSVGVSAGVLKADLVYGGFFLRPNPADPVAPYYDQIASRPNELITEWQRSDGEGYAPNVRAGLLYKAGSKLSLGASLALGTNVTVEGDTYFEYYMPDNPFYHSRSDLNPDSISYILSSGAKLEGNGRFKAEIKLPGQIAAGAAYIINDKLTLSGDLQYTLWSRFDGYKFKYTIADRLSRNDTLNAWLRQNMSVPVDWRNTLRGAIGAEYIYSTMLRLRGGYALDQSAFESGALHPAFFDPGTKQSFNLGVGLVFENIMLDLATEYVRHPQVTDRGNVYLAGDGVVDNIVDNMAGTYSGSAWESIVQFTVRF